MIQFNFCPFARRELERGAIHFQVLDGRKRKALLLAVRAELQRLDNNPQIETSLLIFDSALADFHDYLDFVDAAQLMLEAEGYEGIYQLASFHPQYVFADSDDSDPANYTNRSPLPVLHLLREASLADAVDRHPDPEGIPKRNVVLAREKGREFWQDLLLKSSGF